VFRFSYTSLVTPNSVVDYDMAARTWTVRKQTEVLGGYDPSRYRSERLFGTAPDGTRVFPHTISATGFSDRLIAAILENHQRPGGSVRIPDKLVPYMGGLTELTPGSARRA